MWQQGQVFKLKAKGVDGQPLWAYRYRLEGRGSARPQVGGFATRSDALNALEKVLGRLGPDGLAATMTLDELVDEYLEMHQAEPVTIAKLRWLLAKATATLGESVGGALSKGRVRLASDGAGGASLRSHPGPSSGAEPRGRLGADRLQPGQAGRPEPGPAIEGDAAVRIVAADRGCSRPARVGLRADGRVRRCGRASTVGALRTRASRC
jgi:hypothetical protein